MSTHLNPDLVERSIGPFAVSVRMPGEPRATYVHFADLGAAALYASLLDTPSNEVRRFVANLSTHILYSAAVGVGWFEVGSFDPVLCREVYIVLRGRQAAMQ